jgi:hypothetical protein
MPEATVLVDLETRVEQDIYDEFLALAQENERSIAGELRLAVKNHIAAQRAARDGDKS